MPNWWDDLGDWLGDFVDQAKDTYEQVDQNLGGWLPFGAESPEQAAPEATPDMYGYEAPPEGAGESWGGQQWPGEWGTERALEQAYENPTEPWKATPVEPAVWDKPAAAPERGEYNPWDPEGLLSPQKAPDYLHASPEYQMSGHLTAPVRDIPGGVGGLARTPEAILNALGELSGRTWQPFWGGLQAENPGEQLKRKGGSDWWQEQQATMGEDPQKMLERIQAGLQAVGGSAEEQEAGREKYRNLSLGQQLLGVATDPTNLINLPVPMRLTTAKKGAMAARAIKPADELTTMERLMGSVADVSKKTPEEIGVMTPKDWRLENIPTRIAEKVPVVGKPLGSLLKITGRSRVAEDAGIVTDTVMPRLANAIRQAQGADDAIDLERIGQVLTDIKAPTPEAAAAMGRSGKAPNTKIASWYLEGFDPSTAARNFEKGQADVAELARLRGEIQKGAQVAPDALAAAEKAAEAAPKNRAEALAQFGRDLANHVAKKAHTLYGVSEEAEGLEKAINMQKNFLSAPLLAANINYPVTNAVNNGIMALISGYNPFRMGRTSESVMTDMGLFLKGSKSNLATSRAAAAMGQADVEVKGWQKATALNLARKTEKVQGEGVFSQALQKFNTQAKKVLLPQRILKPEVEASLSSVSRRLPDQIEQIVRYSADSPADAIKKVQSLPGFSKGREMGQLVNYLPENIDGELKAFFLSEAKDVDAQLLKADTKAEWDSILAANKQKLANLRKVEADFRAGGGQAVQAKSSVLKFVDDYTKVHSDTMARAAQRRVAGGAEVYDDLAVMYDEMRDSMRGLVDGLRGDLTGVMPEGRLKAFEGTYTRWQGRTKEYQDTIADIIADNKADPQALAKAKAEAARAYTDSMKGIRSAANKQVTGLLESSYTVPKEKKALMTAYWQKLLNPVQAEEGRLTKYMNGLVNAKDDAARQVLSDKYHAWRQPQWEKANEELAGMRRELFGEAAQQVPGPKAGAARAPTDTTNPYAAFAENKWDFFDKTLDEIAAKAAGEAGQQVVGQVDPFTRKKVINALNALDREFTDAKLAAVQKANVDRDFAMLNYTHRYGYDHYISTVMPFAFWQNTTMKNMALRFAEQPGMFFAYSQYKKMVNDSETAPGFPARLRGMIRHHLPFLPDWMGDQFVDPLGKALPFNQMMYPLQAAQWDQEDQGSLMGLLGSPSPLIKIPLDIASGNAKEVGTLLPATRHIKSTTAMYKEAGLPGAERIPSGGFNLEGGARQALGRVIPGLPEVDQWEPYRIRRMLANMTKMEQITDDEAAAAMEAKSGPIYERARQMVGVESGVGQLPILSGLATVKTHPKGEEQLKALGTDLNNLAMQVATEFMGAPPENLTEAWDVVSENGLAKKGSAISQWYKDNPSYSIRSLATTAEEELPGAFAERDIWKGAAQVPSKYKYEMGQTDQDLLDRWYKEKDPSKFTPEELTKLRGIAGGLGERSATEEGQNLLSLKDQRQEIVDREFARLNGPADVTDKMGWLKEQGATKKGSELYAWNQAHPEYFAETAGGAAYDVLSSVPSAYKKQWTEVQRALVDKFFELDGKMEQMTPVEQKKLQELVDDLTILGGTKNYQQQATWSKELGALIGKVFAENGGPEGVDQMAWIKEKGLNKKGSELYQWWQDHPTYGTSGTTTGTTTGTTYTSTAGAGKDPVLYAEINALIDSEFKRLGGPAGTTDKYGWIKTQNGGKITPAISKWYQDHPGYSSSSSTYTPYSSSYKSYSSGYKNPGGVWTNSWSQLKKFAPTLYKDVGKMFKTGKVNPILIQSLFELYQKLKITIPFEEWIRRLMTDSGMVSQ